MIAILLQSLGFYLCSRSCVKLAPVKETKNESDVSIGVERQSYPIDLGDARCIYGGTLFTTWTEQGKLDGIYTEGQDKDYTEKVVCFTVPEGNTTIASKPGDFKVIATDVAVGDTDCPQGGKRYESFIDIDGSSTYDSNVDKNYNTKKICNGLNGTALLSGANGVIVTSLLEPGDTQCPNGGNKSESFTDINSNGTYESNVDTFYNVRYTCHGSNSITLNTTIPSEDSTCPSGGTLINTFTDINNNGTYESTIDKNSKSYKVCNGQKALVLSTPLGSGDTTCSTGGTQITTCIDSNGDSNCTSGPDLHYAQRKICNGPGTVFLVTTENAGSNCRAGGYKLDSFQDNNHNSVYDVGTDIGYTSTYICNGLNWLSKSTSFTAGNGTVADNTACMTGGTRFEFGYDHVNSSNGAYFVGTDGILDTVEIVSGSTAYSCNGPNGVSGPLISRFQNDSVGASARFYWEIVTENGATPTIKLAYSSTKAGIQAWNCESSLAGVTVVTDFASCTDTGYRNASSGSFNSDSKCGFDLTAAPFSMAEWESRYFKLCAQNSASPYNQTLTSFRVAGNVPSGMVMVHSDDWPIQEFVNTAITPFTYAIDKWEAYLSSGSITNGIPGGCVQNSCISTTTGVLTSAMNQTPATNIDWYASRKACENRTATGYTSSTVPRSIHLQTEMEEFVGNYGTPEFIIYGAGGNLDSASVPHSGWMMCNVDLGHNYGDNTYDGNEFFQTGNIGTKYCISRYGAQDLIGNYGEYLDGYYENLTNNITRQKSLYWGTADRVTTLINDVNLGYAFPVTSIGTFILDWDYQNLLPKPPYYGSQQIAGAKFFNDYFITDFSSTTRPATKFYYGHTGYGTLSGRFQKDLYFPMTHTSNALASRCAIISP